MSKTEHTDIETAVGNLYVQLFRLRQAGQYQEEYDTMGTLINMLTRDRQQLREDFNIKI